ncbi:hypothetical protein E4H12_06985 [Candidatus Thorarchaeota archaeon]|nr:hypothetical protein [Candidatus Thorarchaeota archaeon]TFG98130.1 MAG: hypothetical protein E4H12_06985 [Candidatus Thorarchaeota archaeon]
MDARKIRVCPRCGSSKIQETKTSVNGWLVPTTYFCEETGCGYSGSVFVEVDAEEAEAIKRMMNNEAEV